MREVTDLRDIGQQLPGFEGREERFGPRDDGQGLDDLACRNAAPKRAQRVEIVLRGERSVDRAAVAGFTPTERTLMIAPSTSNQNGAPKRIAIVVMASPASLSQSSLRARRSAMLSFGSFGRR